MMMKRQIIKIIEEKCTGCGLCIPNCPEGALQIIDGKARLISDLFCDGLGACIGNCPEEAIIVEERDAEPYNEAKVLENIMKAGANTIKAHLKHLHEHGQKQFLQEAIAILQKKGIKIPDYQEEEKLTCVCPGTLSKKIEHEIVTKTQNTEIQTELRQWPVQLHLINPNAPYLENADLLISADCVPFAFANFHQRFVKGKIVITLCPKLDRGIESYIEKLAMIFAERNIKSITIVKMEVPCCGGIEVIVRRALEKAGKFIFVNTNTISIDGRIL
jgi:Pyruvate/2-oxoacid:ferredoxin oxidoreductase delta subunit